MDQSLALECHCGQKILVTFAQLGGGGTCPKCRDRLAVKLQALSQTRSKSGLDGDQGSAAERHPNKLNDEAVDLFTSGDANAAIPMFLEVLRRNPQHIEATYNLGVWQWFSGLISERELMSKIRELNESRATDWKVQYLESLIHIKLRDFEKASDILNQLAFPIDSRTLIAEAKDQANQLSDLRIDGQTNKIDCLCMSHDGHKAWSSGDDGKIRQWNLETRRCELVFESFNRSLVSALAVSADDKFIYSSGTDAQNRLWEAATGEEIRVSDQQSEPVQSIALSADGKIGATGSKDGTIRLFNTFSGGLLSSFETKQDPLNTISMSDDGQFIIVGGRNSLNLWDVETEKCVRDFAVGESEILSTQLSADGTKLATAEAGRDVRIWDLPKGECLDSLSDPSGAIGSISISGDGRWLLSGNVNGSIRLWDVSKGKPLLPFSGHAESTCRVCLSPDGRRAITTSHDNMIQIVDFDIDRHQTIGQFTPAVCGPLEVSAEKEFEHEFDQALADARSAKESNDVGKAAGFLRKARSYSGREADPALLNLWNSFRDETPCKNLLDVWERRSIQSSFDFDDATLITDGNWATVGSPKNNCVQIWDLSLDTPQMEIRDAFHGVEKRGCHRLSPDHKWVATGNSDSIVRLWGAGTAKLGSSIENLPGDIHSIRWSVDANTLYAGCSDGSISVCDVSLGEVIHTIADGGGAIHAFALSHDERWALVGGKWTDGTHGECSVRLLDLKKKKYLNGFGKKMFAVTAVELNRDGKRAATLEMSGHIKLWNLETGSCQQTFDRARKKTRAICISPDGRWVLTGEKDGTICVWDGQKGERIRTLNHHEGEIKSISISGNARWLLSAGGDGTLRKWELDWDF
jgi:WD40 repeat protein